MTYRITLEGVVQGVGFRPFVKRVADLFHLSGVTFNTAGGLVIEVEAKSPAEARAFLENIQTQAPSASRIASCELEELHQPAHYESFQIIASSARDRRFTLISADLATCPACLAEVLDPADRRFGYAFTNCTNCGPRYSITLSTPYDRANTTMRPFPMCADCAREYTDPTDRRFHAEPIACPACGPQLSHHLSEMRSSLARGEIIALKGLGGYQLACDAFSSDAVELLRIRKRRSLKPFAVMMRDVETAREYCTVSEPEANALAGPSAPIVLLPMLHGKVLHGKVLHGEAFPPGVAPGLREIGVMLPCTPLHHLLFTVQTCCLVMTSGNISEEPIVIANSEAEEKLSGLSDQLLTHNRDIFMRVDDSVVRIFEGVPRVLRRARGFAPEAIALGREMEEVLACGGELKNTLCLTKGRFAILSQHLGDLENYETLQFFEETLRNLQTVYQATPRLIAHDLHPDYLGTRWAQARPEPKIAIQHHHAHIASCMAENSVTGPVIGVAFDGTGFGSDGQIWGGEFLLCDYAGFNRVAHLRYLPLPGGDRAARQPWRMAAAHLHDALGPNARQLDLPSWNASTSTNWKLLEQMICKPALLTSSCGRLFDAVASICGIGQENTYEGQSAMLLEAAAASFESDEMIPMSVAYESDPWIVDTRKLVESLARGMSAGKSPQLLARCFHNSIAYMIEVVCRRVRERNGVNRVCLSGGTFQNITLLTPAVGLLRSSGFEVLLHSKVPSNDGGLSLGQAVIAAHFLSKDNPDVPRHTR